MESEKVNKYCVVTGWEDYEFEFITAKTQAELIEKSIELSEGCPLQAVIHVSDQEDEEEYRARTRLVILNKKISLGERMKMQKRLEELLEQKERILRDISDTESQLKGIATPEVGCITKATVREMIQVYTPNLLGWYDDRANYTEKEVVDE